MKEKLNFFMFILLVVLVIVLYAVANAHLPMKVSENGVPVSEYANPKEFGEDPVYEMVLNKKGVKIFKEPWAALLQVRKDCSKAISHLRWQHKIPFTLGRWNYQVYKTYGWQLTTADEEVRRQGMKLSQCVDIFENSFTE